MLFSKTLSVFSIVALIVVGVGCKKLAEAPNAKLSEAAETDPCFEKRELRDNLRNNYEFLNQEQAVEQQNQEYLSGQAVNCKDKGGKWADEKCVCDDGIVIDLYNNKDTCTSAISIIEALRRQCESSGGKRVEHDCRCSDGSIIDPIAGDKCLSSGVDTVGVEKRKCDAIKGTYWSTAADACYCNMQVIDPSKVSVCKKTSQPSFDTSSNRDEQIKQVIAKLSVAERVLAECIEKNGGSATFSGKKQAQKLPTGCVCGKYGDRCMIWKWDRPYDHAEAFIDGSSECKKADCDQLLERYAPKNCDGKIDRYYESLEGIVE